MSSASPWGLPLGTEAPESAETNVGENLNTRPSPPASLAAAQQQTALQAAAAPNAQPPAPSDGSDTIGGLTSRPASLPGNPDAAAATAAAAAIQGAAALTAEAGQALAAAAQAGRRQQRAEELRAAVLTPAVARTPAQADMVLEFLAGSYGLLRNLQPSVLRLLGQAMEGLALDSGEVLYSVGDPSSSGSFYVVVHGEVGLWEPAGADVTPTASASTDAAGAVTMSGIPEAGGSSAAVPAGASKSGTSGGVGGSSSASEEERSGGSKSGTKPGVVGAKPAAVSPAAPTMVEVLRAGPRESFGDDDLIPGGKRQQTAKAAAGGKSDWWPSSSLGVAPSAAASGPPAGGWGRSPTKGRAAAGKAAAGSTAAAGGLVVLLALPADDYYRVLQGRMGRMQEEKVDFLETLPALQGLTRSYLRDLAHCFHQTEFEPREVVVRQGEVADSMFIIRSGQVCVLIDPAFTAAAAVEGQMPEQDLKRLVQVVILGPGSLIGDMSVTVGARRSATVVALTDLVTYKVQLSEWRRRMPEEVLENMRKVASAKAAMNEQQAERRRAMGTQRQGAYVMLGERAVPQAVLQGRTLRALADPRKNQAPIEVLRAALAALPGAGMAGAREAAVSEAFLQSLGMSGPGAVAPRALLAGHIEGGSTIGTTAPPRASGFWGAFPLPVPRGPQLPGVQPTDDSLITAKGDTSSHVASAAAAGSPITGLGSSPSSGPGSGRQSPSALGAPALADDFEELAKQLRQQRLTPRTAAAAAAAAPQRSASVPAEGAVKAAAAAAAARLMSSTSPQAAAGGVSPRAAGGFAGGLRHSLASTAAAARRLGVPGVSGAAAVSPAIASQGLMVVTSVAGRAAGMARAASPSAAASAAAINVAAAAEAAAAAAAASSATVAASDPAMRAVRAGVVGGLPMADGAHDVDSASPGTVDGVNHGLPCAAASVTASTVPGFTGPLLQSTGGLMAAASAATRQQHAPQPPTGPLGPTTVSTVEVLAPGELPSGVQAVVLRSPSNKEAQPQLLFHGASGVIGAGVEAADQQGL